MREYLWASLGLAALCAGWVVFQRWLERVDPDGRRIEDSQGCGRSCSDKCGKMSQSDVQFAVVGRARGGKNYESRKSARTGFRVDSCDS